MKTLALIVLLLSFQFVHALSLRKIIPSPINPIPICNACWCGHAGKCAEDAQRAAEEAAAQAAREAARLAEEAEKKTRELAEQHAAAVVQNAQNAMKDLETRTKDAVKLAENEINRQVDLVETTVKSIEQAADNHNFVQGLIDSAKTIVQAQIDVQRERFMDALNFVLKNNIKSLIKEKQVLVIVSELEKWAEENRAIYRFTQVSGIPMAQATLSDWYDQIIVLEKSQATKENLLRVLGEQAAREKIKAIDLFVFLHGLPGEVAFFEGDVKTEQLGTEIAALPTHGKLRMVYNTSCYGASHIGDFLRAGFKVASGSQAINVNAATEYPAFLEVLSLGQPFGIAIALGNTPQANAASDAIARSKGMSPVQSNKNIGGDAAQSYLYSAAKWALEGLIKL